MPLTLRTRRANAPSDIAPLARRVQACDGPAGGSGPAVRVSLLRVRGLASEAACSQGRELLVRTVQMLTRLQQRMAGPA